MINRVAVEAMKDLKGNRTTYRFAKDLGIPQPTIHRILQGKTGIGMQVARKLVACYPELRDVLLGETQAENTTHNVRNELEGSTKSTEAA